MLNVLFYYVLQFELTTINTEPSIIQNKVIYLVLLLLFKIFQELQYQRNYADKIDFFNGLIVRNRFRANDKI